MNNWIELNLPYNKTEFFVNDFELPNLDDRAKQELGFNRSDLESIYKSVPDYSSEDYSDMDKAREEIDRQLNAEFQERNADWKNERVKRFLNSSNKSLRILGNYLQKRFVIEDWEDKQSEMIAYDKDCREKMKEFQDNLNKQSFTGLGLNKAGTLIEVKTADTVRQYLIGHINPICGTCNDCVEFDGKIAIVLRYKVIWSE